MITKVGLVQLQVSDTQTIGVRRRQAAKLIRAAASDGADVVILPELWPTGAFDTDAMNERVYSDFDEFVRFGGETAAAAGVWLHAGSDVEVTAEGRRYNTSVMFNPKGSEVARYRKMHLWGGAEGEAGVLSSGDAPLVVQSPLGFTGVTTCYELRFPELYRVLVDQGAKSYIVVAGWPQTRVEHWRTLLRARAIENQAWVLGVNCVGTHAGVRMGGFSAVVSPQGEVVAEASGEREEMLLVDVDMDLVTQWRSKFRWLDDRRSY